MNMDSLPHGPVLAVLALQLKGIVLGVNLLIGAGADATGSRVEDTALIVTLVQRKGNPSPMAKAFAELVTRKTMKP